MQRGAEVGAEGVADMAGTLQGEGEGETLNEELAEICRFTGNRLGDGITIS